MARINLTITAKYIKVEHLASSGAAVSGTDYYTVLNISKFADELDGWWIDRDYSTANRKKIAFADIVNLNGSAIGATTQAQVTALFVAALYP